MKRHYKLFKCRRIRFRYICGISPRKLRVKMKQIRGEYWTSALCIRGIGGVPEAVAVNSLLLTELVGLLDGCDIAVVGSAKKCRAIASLYFKE